MAAGSLASGWVLAFASFSFSILTILYLKQYMEPSLASVSFYQGGVLVEPPPGYDFYLLGYSLGFMSPAYAAVSLYLLWGGRRTLTYALYYYGRLYLLKVMLGVLLYSAGYVAAVALYLVSAVGDLRGSLMIAGSFAADIAFFTIILSTIAVRTDALPVVIIALVMARFFSIPQESAWFASLPLAAAYTAAGARGAPELLAVAAAYYAVAILAYWRWVRE